MADEEQVSKALPGGLNNEIGRTGLRHNSGILYEEFLPQLQGKKAVQQYREMRDNSAIVGSMLFAIESLLRSVEWSVEPESEDEADFAAAEFLDECMYDMSNTWADFISEVLSMLVYGWSFFEVVMKKRSGPGRNPKTRSKYNDNRWGWRKFAFRSQDTLYRWEIEMDGGIRGMHQMPPPSQYSEDGIIFLPIEKCMLFRTTSHKNSPEGRSILRNAYKSYFMASKMELLEAIGAERDLAGMPVMWVPPEILSANPTTEERAAFETLRSIVTRVRRDEQEGLMLPLQYDENGNKMFDFTLMSSGGKRQVESGSIIQRNIQQIAMTCLADFVLLGHENVGSFALSSDKTELFAVALGSWLDNIEEVINRYAVTPLFELNKGFGVEHPPRIVHGDIEKPNLIELAQFVQQLSGAGAPLFPDLLLENHLRNLADLPEVDPEQRAQQQQELMEQEMGMQQGAGGQQQQQQLTSDTLFSQLSTTPSFDQFAARDDTVPIEKAKGNPFNPGPLTGSYYDGSKWKPMKSRHKFRKMAG